MNVECCRRFAAECEAAGMKISSSKSEAMVLDRQRVDQGTAQDALEGLCLSAGLGAPWAPPGGAGGGVLGEGHLGVSAECAAPATRSQISGRRRVRMLKFKCYSFLEFH
ncbi:hypothetical protein XENOCAPTIV_025991 [Xenoophorus captivus]|uniref:Uncharacterized protein n=1 Tax=Xenoophorus captivus TaxID=1517983 RepID=A0ABV0QK53_9TELE